MNTGLFFKLMVILGFISIQCVNDTSSEYNIENPTKKVRLPRILQEVSGITELDSTHIVCVQDENGILFVVDVNSGEITKQIEFGLDGDYEGITKVENVIYILRSDGTLIELIDWDTENLVSREYSTSKPAKNNESLGYDQKNNRLLIGTKTQPGKGPEFKDLRAIYSFDLQTKTVSLEPIYEFSVSEIADSIKAAGYDLPIKIRKNTGEQYENFKFGISALAIHPETGDLHLLAAIDYLYVVFDHEGQIKLVKQLPKNLYPQAEGITFLADGSMVITSEGVDDNATLLIINQ